MDLRKEVLYYDALVDFPTNGQENKLYLNKADGALYYWDGSAYALAGDGSGGVTGVTASSPLSSSGGATPNITLTVPSDNTKFLDGTGSFDTVKDSDLSLSDITTNDVSTSKHGFAPKAPNDTTKFLRGDGTWAVPSSGGLTKFTEAENTSSPNGTVYVDSLTAAASSTNADFAIVPKGNGAILADIPNNLASGGNKRGEYAVDLQLARGSASQVASGNYSFAAGSSNTASGIASVCLGSTCSATGLTGIATGEGCTTGSNGFSNGYYSTASAYASMAVGRFNTASNDYAVALGVSNTSSGEASFSAGSNNVANGQYSSVLGFASHSFGINGRQVVGRAVNTAGDCQKSFFPLYIRTTDATATTVTVGGGAAGATNQVILSNQSAFRFKGTIIGKKSGTTDVAAWDVDGLIVRGANAASTTLSVSNVTLIQNTPAWGTPTLAADTTNGGLRVQVTGAATTNIQWTCTIETTEVIYA